MVNKYGTDHEQFDLNPEQDLEGAIHELSYYSDEPSADSGALPVWFLSKLCRANCTVAFSGEGADEIFGGYLTYRANRIAQACDICRRQRCDLALQYSSRMAWLKRKNQFEYKLKRLLEGSLLPPEQGHVYWNGTFSQVEKPQLLKIP